MRITAATTIISALVATNDPAGSNTGSLRNDTIAVTLLLLLLLQSSVSCNIIGLSLLGNIYTHEN